jgi:hypothetical protein
MTSTHRGGRAHSLTRRAPLGVCQCLSGLVLQLDQCRDGEIFQQHFSWLQWHQLDSNGLPLAALALTASVRALTPEFPIKEASRRRSYDRRTVFPDGRLSLSRLALHRHPGAYADSRLSLLRLSGPVGIGVRPFHHISCGCVCHHRDAAACLSDPRERRYRKSLDLSHLRRLDLR